MNTRRLIRILTCLMPVFFILSSGCKEEVSNPCEEGEVCNIIVLPNPLSGKGKIQFISNKKTQYVIKTFDLQGQEKQSHEFEIRQGFNNHPIDFTELIPGTYLLCIETKTESYCTKAIRN